MSKTSKIVAITLIVAILIVGVGYAAIQNITLNISGEAKANPEQGNFTVVFSGEPTTSKTVAETSVDASVTAAVSEGGLNATINANNLTAKGDTVTATYTIQNTSADLSADLSAITSNSNTEYFDVSYAFEGGKTNLKAGEAITITVTVKVIKTPIETSVSSTVGVKVTAVPAQPQS